MALPVRAKRLGVAAAVTLLLSMVVAFAVPSHGAVSHSKHKPVRNPGRCGAVVVGRSTPVQPTSTPTKTKPTPTPTKTKPTPTPTKTKPTPTPTKTQVTPTPTLTFVPTVTATLTATITLTPTVTETVTVIPTVTLTATASPTATSTGTSGKAVTRSGTSSAKKKKPVAKRADVVCVWPSLKANGKPQWYFKKHANVALLAAWSMGKLQHIGKYRLHLRWTVFGGYQQDVSLLPQKHKQVAKERAKDPAKLKAGTYRLKFAPLVKHLKKGWYSLAGRAMLTGPGCPKSGCTGTVRQTRFHLK